MRTHIVIAIMLIGVGLASGCATKRYVSNVIDPIRAKLNQVATHTNWNAAAIDENRRQIKAVEERAESGISGANERALLAENIAKEALKRATEAKNVASEARARGEKNMSGLETLRTAVSNFEDYKLVAEATVQFEYDQDSLTREAKQVLDQFAAKKGPLKTLRRRRARIHRRDRLNRIQQRAEQTARGRRGQLLGDAT